VSCVAPTSEYGRHAVKRPGRKNDDSTQGAHPMPEGSNIELAHKLTEQEHDGHDGQARPWHRFIEFAEVAILAIVAIATAWSGFQATQWDGEQSFLYGEASRDRFEAEAESTLAGQELGANSAMFTAWLQAHSAGDATLQTEMSNRFTPDYRKAFDAWLALDPFENPAAPPGPAAMPEYHNPHRAEAERINAAASEKFDTGTEARETGDKYVRATVLFASVLFLVAVGQRFKAHAARLGVNVVAALVLVYTVASVAGIPRA
jgi:hypothetical protein